MKINLTSTLKNLNNGEIEINKVIAKKEKNKIVYKIDDMTYTIKIVSPSKIILNRSNDELECTMYFELEKIIPSCYIIKKEGYTLEIDIKTITLSINENLINMNYIVIDANENYEYKIEMSEIE